MPLIDAVADTAEATVGANPYASFDEATREYVITRPDTPAPVAVQGLGPPHAQRKRTAALDPHVQLPRGRPPGGGHRPADPGLGPPHRSQPVRGRALRGTVGGELLSVQRDGGGCLLRD